MEKYTPEQFKHTEELRLTPDGLQKDYWNQLQFLATTVDNCRKILVLFDVLQEMAEKNKGPILHLYGEIYPNTQEFIPSAVSQIDHDAIEINNLYPQLSSLKEVVAPFIPVILTMSKYINHIRAVLGMVKDGELDSVESIKT